MAMRKPLPSRTAVTDVLANEERPLRVEEVAERLGVGPETHEGLLRLLDNLVFDGAVVARGDKFKLERKHRPSSRSEPTRASKQSDRPLPGYRVEPAPKSEREERAPKSERPAKKSGREDRLAKVERLEARSRRGGERREGVLTVNPRGFGFVASPTATGDDVFISPEALSGAMHGDRVIVEIVGRGTRGAEGQIVEVKERGTKRVSGILRRRTKSAWVEPDDPRVRGPVVLTRDIDLVDGEGNSGIDGQVVVVQITRFPDEPGMNPEGKLVAVLGAPGELSVEVRKVLFLASIEEVHSPQAVDEAEAYGLEVPASMLEGREDLTHIPLPTIDPEDARDHDDAVWVERTASGGYEVWVAIADVSSYVRPGTKIDEEARTRGCSIYLPDRAIPMLPRALSSNLCSLLPDVVRLCLCVHAELDAKGQVKKSRLVRGYMKSAAKLTYGGVARALGFTEQPPVQPKAEEMVEGLRVAYECSRHLRSRRMKRGALDFDLPEAVVKLDTEGKPIEIKKRAQDPGVKKAYQLIEELMIFANEVVARWLLDHDLPGVYRVHLPPDPKKLDRLAAMCEMLGVDFDADATQTPKGLSELLKSFAQNPLSNVLNNLLLRSMKQATYDVQNLGHFGLASEAYLHFTSPIRRYPDLVVHRIVHAALEGDERTRKKAVRQVGDIEKLTEAAVQSSIAERRAMEIERETVDIYRCFYMIDRIGDTYEGIVGAFVGAGAFVTLDNPFVDVLVRVEDLGPDFTIEDDGLSARGARSGDTVMLGDQLLVTITDAAILRRTVYARRVRGESGPYEGDGESRRRGGNAPPKRGRLGGTSESRKSRGGPPSRAGSGAGAGKRRERPGEKPARGGKSFAKSDGRSTTGKPFKKGKPKKAKVGRKPKKKKR